MDYYETLTSMKYSLLVVFSVERVAPIMFLFMEYTGMHIAQSAREFIYNLMQMSVSDMCILCKRFTPWAWRHARKLRP